ncbi:MAG: hypothetical protein JSV66_02565 [Trueperaceae bacterium]|nr:MAG: hypothetical protein JSV66_02565 [Trueperaceae bacterium]
MIDTATLMKDEIANMASAWYRKLDVHAPMVEILPMLADEELQMVFPEATVTGWAGFEGWYQRVIRIFFDEVHTLKEVTPSVDGDKAEVKVVVQWEASMWDPPAAESARIKCDAYQRWVVKRSPVTKRPVITAYIVDRLEYHEGSAKL